MRLQPSTGETVQPKCVRHYVRCKDSRISAEIARFQIYGFRALYRCSSQRLRSICPTPVSHPVRTMHKLVARALLPAAAMLTVASAVAAQSVTETQLAAPNASIKDFKTPEVALGLTDATIVVADAKLGKLVLVDFGSNSSKELMKQGGKDGQFEGISRLWGWQGDSVAAFDSVANRLYVISEAGGAPRIQALGGGGRRGGGAAPPGAAAGRGGGRGGMPMMGGGGMRGMPQPVSVVDGKYVFMSGVAAPASVKPGNAPPRNTLPILRTTLGARPSIDTIARFLPKQPNKTSVRHPNNTWGATARVEMTLDISDYIPSDLWWVYKDGSVGVARGADYHIDIYGPGDAREKYDPISFPEIPISNSEKKRTQDEFKKIANTTVDQGWALVINEGFPWPDAHPPFRHDVPAILDASGRAWLRVRCENSDQLECYDVINRLGMRVMRVRLPEKTKLLAVGSDAAFTAYFEKSDKAVLQRHPLN